MPGKRENPVSHPRMVELRPDISPFACRLAVTRLGAGAYAAADISELKVVTLASPIHHVNCRFVASNDFHRDMGDGRSSIALRPRRRTIGFNKE